VTCADSLVIKVTLSCISFQSILNLESVELLPGVQACQAFFKKPRIDLWEIMQRSIKTLYWSGFDANSRRSLS
jgi:hypothetical protein